MSTSTRNLRERTLLARGLERAARGPSGRGVVRAMYPIIRPTVATACAPGLTRVVSALRDADREVSTVSLVAIRELLTLGAASPLYGPSPAAATDAIAAIEAQLAPVAIAA
jgi:hypothetical protein